MEEQKHASDNNNISHKLNVLRAGVLGANDGIVSTAGLVVGVAGATTDTTTILISGLAGLVAGALSMAGGEYVSVSTQKDTEEAEIAKETEEISTNYEGELDELTQIYQKKGLSEPLAKQVATELMDKNAVAAHAEAELNINPEHYANPYYAALTSMTAFAMGAILPLLSITLLPVNIRITGTFVVILISLVLTGYISAKLGDAPKKPAIVRNVVVGCITMIITYLVGYFFHVNT